MGLQFDVQVLDSNDSPVAGVLVTAHLHETNDLADLWKGGTLEQYTDDEGHASFECGYDEHDYVVLDCRGERSGPHDIEDGAGFTIRVP